MNRSKQVGAMGKHDAVHQETGFQIEASKAHRNGYVNLVVRRSGLSDVVKTLHPLNAEQVHAFALKANVTDEALRDAIGRLVAAKQDTSIGPSADFAVILRGMSQPAKNGKRIRGESPLAALESALTVADYPFPEPVIEWSSTEKLVALDLDFHDVPLCERRDPGQLNNLLSRVRPGPVFWWVTHGRGLRLIYGVQEGMTAAELASCAGLTLKSNEPTATIEMLAHTRHPGYPRPGYPDAGPWYRETPTVEVGLLASWLARDVGQNHIEEWLSDHGLERGRRYPHDRCPVDPSTASHNDPVSVGDGGIFCHKCAATGLRQGSGRAGFFPWASLVGGGLSPRLRTAARHCCHWDHAQYIVAEDIGLEGEMAKLCYSALLKVVNGAEDPRTHEAMYRGKGLVRMDGYWAPADLSRPHKNTGLAKRLKVLPAVRYPTKKADGSTKLVTDHEMLGIFQGVEVLVGYGYPHVQPVRGMRVFGQFHTNTNPGVVHAVILPDHLRSPQMQAHRPRYVPAVKRMPLKEAEAILEVSFPGIRHSYIRLLVAALGCAEAEIGQPPRMAVDGPSGAGKDASVRVAAMLVGDRHRNVSWIPDVREFTMSMYEASLNAGLVTCSEIIKFIRAKKCDLLLGLSPLLTLERDASARVLFEGYLPLHHVPPIIITDISFPRELHNDEQAGRRFIYVHLERTVDWQRTAQNLEYWRSLRPENAEAANAIVSHVIDEYFGGDEPIVFEEIARRLGFPLLKNSGEMGLDPREDRLVLFNACCSTDAIPAPAGTKWRGRGWCLVKRRTTDPVSSAWSAVCDPYPEGFTSSRRVKEADLARLLGVKNPVECDISPNGGSTLAIRFRCGDARSPHVRFNAEIIRNDQPPDSLPHFREPPDEPPPPVNTPAPTGVAPVIIPGSPASWMFPEPSPEPEHRVDDSGPIPVFIDLRTRSTCRPEEGGRRYAEHPATEILSVAALIDAQVIVWTPTMTESLPVEELWPERAEPKLQVAAFAGPAMPAPLASAITSGRSLCAHNASEIHGRLWTSKSLVQPVGWIDTMLEARAAGLPHVFEDLVQDLFAVGTEKEEEEFMWRLSRPDQRGQFLPFNQRNAVRNLRFSITQMLLLGRVYDIVRGHAEPDVVAFDRDVNDRGIGFDLDLARTLINLEAQDAREIHEEVARLTGGAIKSGDLRRDSVILD